MYKSKPVAILKSFTKKELRLFETALHSPLFNKSQAAIQLFKLLEKAYPAFIEEKVDREKIYRGLYPKEKSFNEQALRYVMSDLTKALEAFMIWQETKAGGERFLAKAYMKRGLSKYFIKSMDLLKRNLEKAGFRDADYHLQQFELAELRYKGVQPKGEELKKTLEALLNHMDHFYVANKLKYTCEVLNYNNVFNESLLADASIYFLLDEIINKLGDVDMDTPAIKLYYQIFLTLHEPNAEEHFDGLLKLIQAYNGQFQADELYDSYIYALNYCVRKLYTGRSDYLQRMSDLYDLLLEEGVLPLNGKMSEWDYKNIVTVKLRLAAYPDEPKTDLEVRDELNKIEQFINTYQSYIPNAGRENAYTFNFANLSFSRGDLDKTITLLNQVEFTNTYYHLDTKILLVKCYYELQEIIPLFNLIDTLKAYLRRNKQASETNRRTYISFLNNVKKLTRIRLGSRKTLNEIKTEIQQSPFAGMHTNWLMSKVEELE